MTKEEVEARLLPLQEHVSHLPLSLSPSLPLSPSPSRRQAAKTSMGYDISDIDMLNVQTFADRVINLEEYRQRLREYLNR